jgi:hypothetical protein
VPKVYRLVIPTEKLQYATDMLRYEGAFQVDIQGGNAKIEMLSFTPERWASFGVTCPQPLIDNALAADYKRKGSEAQGFLRGIRFAQAWIQKFPQQTYLVQS